MENSNNSIKLPLYIAAALALGIFIGAQMIGESTSGPDLMQNLTKLRQVITHIENDYVDEVDTEKLVDGAIENMLAELDPHSVYISREEIELARAQLQGNFEGIGVEFNIFKDTITVVAPLSGGPSEKLGIRSGDKIVMVDGDTVAGIGITNRMVIDKLRGPKGSEVEVKILRKGEGELLDFAIKRDVIPQYSLDVAYMVDDETGYIKISRFSATTYMEFKEALLKLKEQGMEKLVLDLTGNPGGYLDRAVDMVDEFLEDNQMIVYTEGKESRYNDSHISRRKGEFENGPLIVLMDEGSASASEIVAGALQDHDRALIVGRRSFGKGLVQMPIPLKDGSELRLTISRYYTPSGRSIQKPYDEGIDEYRQEYVQRFESGEVYDVENLKVNDSLVYSTDKGRTVYGGGGIVPDYFVPYDTAGNSRYLSRLITTNTLSEFTLDYVQANKVNLESMGRDDYLRNFKVTDDMLASLREVAEQNGLSFNSEQYNRSKTLIKLYTKAYIARGVWDNEGFYPVINEQNEVLQKALGLFDEAVALASN
jgi:carboxyl-terminal processing protease